MGARTDVVTAILAMLDDFIAANPTLLRRRFKTRPPSLVTDLPCAYVDLRPERINYFAGVRDRHLSPSIVFVDQLTDNGETMARFDALIDAFTDHLDSYSHLFLGTGINNVWSDGSWADEAEQIGDGNPAAAARWTFEDILFKQGRS